MNKKTYRFRALFDLTQDQLRSWFQKLEALKSSRDDLCRNMSEKNELIDVFQKELKELRRGEQTISMEQQYLQQVRKRGVLKKIHWIHSSIEKLNEKVQEIDTSIVAAQAEIQKLHQMKQRFEIHESNWLSSKTREETRTHQSEMDELAIRHENPMISKGKEPL